MQDDHPRPVLTREDSARRFHELPVSRGAREFERPASALGMIDELLDARQHPAHQRGGRCGVFDRDVIGDGVQVGQGRFGPDYLSHRSSRRSASSPETTRPSATAISPRAIPSRMVIRSCWRR